MTSNETTQRDVANTVVVGVNGTDDNVGALRFAVAEAQTLGAALKLIHVVPDHLPVPATMPTTAEEFDATGHRILTTATAMVRELAPDLHVEGWLHHGTRPVELVAGAAGARALVVGRDGHSLVERLLRGDIATGVAARAEMPVIEVPADWRPRPSDAERVVVAGVKAPGQAADLLADAFEVARQRDATLVVLHAWRLPSAYSDIVESPTAAAAWARQSTLELEGVLRTWRSRFPDLKVDVRVVYDRPSDALVEASRDADLVVLVRRDRGRPPAAHLGSTARAVLRSAHCPVRIVAPAKRGD